jgi:hypothetical protein
MAILAWRPRASSQPSQPSRKKRDLLPGEYAGRARFRPVYPEVVPPTLRPAIGRVVEVGYAGVAAPDAVFAGQDLYLEWRRDDVFDGFEIPARDLEFLE